MREEPYVSEREEELYFTPDPSSALFSITWILSWYNYKWNDKKLKNSKILTFFSFNI